jgi:tight adherence protein B
VTGILLGLLAALGAYLLYTSLALGRRSIDLMAPLMGPDHRRRRHEWMAQAGLADVPFRELTGVIAILGVAGLLAGYAVFGALLPAFTIGGFAATFPIASYQARRRARRSAAMDAWPRLLEELRILTSSLGRSVPQALFETGRRAPREMRDAFDAAEREWFLSTDFSRTIHVLKTSLADPTADAACETLLVAHEIGGTDLDRRLEALIDDRIQDTHGRKDARAKQAGARFARRFVLIVPAGMAMAGMSVGTGRAAYQTPTGQSLVVAAVGLVVICWVWAGRIMSVPAEGRVFDD